MPLKILLPLHLLKVPKNLNIYTMKMVKMALFMLWLSPFTACFKVKDVPSNSKPISHALYDSLLHKYVNHEGLVDYKSFIKDSLIFNKYLNLLSQNHPNEKNWTKDERLAYWLNAYNAFTIKLICQYYPVASIKDVKKGIPFVNDTWTIDFIKIEGKTYNLNTIEHGIVRPKFNDPRVHTALNCASMSCPKLLNEAYKAEHLTEQLDAQMREFLKDSSRNKIISSEKAELSKIFTWFEGDFKKISPSVIAFINKYAAVKLNENAKLTYWDYDWKLNEQK
jgi:Protein of unknown function, DUF547